MQINLLLVAANATVSATIATTSTSGSSTSSKLLAINQIICQMYVIVILISVACYWATVVVHLSVVIMILQMLVGEF